MRRTATVTAIVAALLTVPAVAWAHPGFNPSELPPGEPAESTLVVPHGCAPDGGMPEPDAGEAEPTVELALQHTEGVTVEPGEVDGWTITDDGEAWVWSDDGGATTDVIELPVTLTVDEDVTTGDELYLKAFQECANGSAFQWVGTPDEEASFPAIRLTAGEGGVGTTGPDDSTTMDHDEPGTDVGEDAATDEDTPDDETATDDDVASGEDGDGTTGVDEPPTEDTPAGDDGLSPAVVAVLVVALCAAVGAAVVLRRRSA